MEKQKKINENWDSALVTLQGLEPLLIRWSLAARMVCHRLPQIRASIACGRSIHDCVGIPVVLF